MFITANSLYFSYVSEDNNANTTVTEVLKNINLNINSGEFVCVLGTNGSGKSTLARLINAILLPSSGDVLVDGMNTKNSDKLLDIRKKVGMVFQNPDNQIVATIVEEDVAFALENMGVEPSLMRQKVDEALEIVGMSKYRVHATHALSGGQKQRIAIAGVLAMHPECIVLDEPTAMLDPIGRASIIKTIKKLNKEYGITIVLITHHMDEATLADRVLIINKGEIVMDDVPQKIFSQVEKIKALGLDVPQVTELMHRMNLPSDIIDEEECIDELTNYLNKSETRK
jgi:energy-coupling factor transport system ATP-binding protein